MCVNWQKGSYTIESAILVPLFFGILLFAINSAIAFYGACTQTEQFDRLEVDVMETFYLCQKLDKLQEKGE